MRRRRCCRSSRTTSGSSTPSCWSPPSGWACGSARSRWTGSTTPTRGCDIVSTAADDLRGVWRMLVRRPKGLRRIRSNEVTSDQLLRFAGVGVVSTLGYLFLFVAWRPLIGPFGANAVAMAIATLFNTAVHRELSSTTDGQTRRGRLLAVAGGAYAVSLAFTTLGLARRPMGGSGCPASPSSLRSPWPTWSPPSSGSPCCGPGSSARAPARAPTRWRCHDDGPHARPRRPRRAARAAG